MAKIFDDDASFGKVAPSLDSLDVLKGDAPASYEGKVTVVFFLSKLAKDEYVTFIDFSKIANQFKDSAQFVGIALDGAKGDVEGLLKKLGTAMPELNVTSLDLDYPVAYDEGNKVRKAFQTSAELMSVGSGFAFVIGKDGKIVWREYFTRSSLPSNGQLISQLSHVVAGEPIELKNGKAPVEEDSDDCEMGGGEGDDGEMEALF